MKGIAHMTINSQTNVKLDSRKRISLTNYFPNIAEVRITQVNSEQIIVEPVVSYTPAEIRAMCDPDVIATEQRIFTQSEPPKGRSRKEIKAALAAKKKLANA